MEKRLNYFDFLPDELFIHGIWDYLYSDDIVMMSEFLNERLNENLLPSILTAETIDLIKKYRKNITFHDVIRVFYLEITTAEDYEIETQTLYEGKGFVERAFL